MGKIKFHQIIVETFSQEEKNFVSYYYVSLCFLLFVQGYFRYVNVSQLLLGMRKIVMKAN